MKQKIVSIIGGTHGMGGWLAKLLIKNGCTVYVTGRNTKMTAADAAVISDTVVVSVPIVATADVISAVGPLLREDQCLMDLTSLKKEPVAQMLLHSVAEVVGCHPLFGPSITRAQGNSIVLCPGRGKAGYEWIRNIFNKEGYTILERTPEEHDRMMSIVQALNHVNTLAMGMAIAATDISLAQVDPFSTPIFRSKMEIVKKVMMDSPDMYVDIITGNPDAAQIVDTYLAAVQDIQKLISSKDVATFKHIVSSTAKKLF